jgi:hypothetical protein
MRRMILVVLSILAVSASVFAQSTAEIDKALLAAPPQMKEAATVIKWKADFTYETLKKGTNRLVCYDRTGQPGQQPFAVECTSIAQPGAGRSELEVGDDRRQEGATGSL